ncbi:hypothetical protein HC766_01305 [Candidatus Gracilibacteria bacterium]|nr:hypothetical protein [Candidatus Gracilibacteria bacterium]
MGGVVPEVGARTHSSQIHLIFEEILEKLYPQKNLEDQLEEFSNNLKEIFVTNKPGLKSALRVGEEFAKSIKFFLWHNFSLQVQVQCIDHLHGHLSSCFFDNEQNLDNDAKIFPHLHLIVSGGNSQILFLENPKKWSILGTTLDDAAGESLDKIGRMLGLPYPGGVWISKIAGIIEDNSMNFPVGMNNSKLAYSFSGLKTSVRVFLEKVDVAGFVIEKKLNTNEIEQLIQSNGGLNPKLKLIKEVCISSQNVIVNQLVNKLNLAIDEYQPSSIGLSGGVSANPLLRQKIQSLDVSSVLIPPIDLTGDNAVMIALAGLSKKYIGQRIGIGLAFLSDHS